VRLRIHLNNLVQAMVLPVALSVVMAAAGISIPHFALLQSTQLYPSSARRPVVARTAWQPEILLQQPVTLTLRDVSLEEALDALAERTGVTIAYHEQAIARVAKRISLDATGIALQDVLDSILTGTGWTFRVQSEGQLALTPSRLQSRPPRDTSGTGGVHGVVIDAGSKDPVVGALVYVDEGKAWAMTDAAGQYRIAALPAGSHVLAARRIGYREMRTPVSISAGHDTVVDLQLVQSASILDQVVVTGTVTPTAVKAMSTPVTIITAEDFQNQYVRATPELLRQQVPGALAPDNGPSVQQTTLSVRGASTLVGGKSSLKVYIDGVEISAREYAMVDPNSIERMEVIRGPEAAAIYGSDAISGVVQVFTKKGHSGYTKPEVTLSAAVGAVQSRYARGGVLHQEYAASARGGVGTASYNVGASYTHTGEWVPEFSLSNPSVYGGAHLGQGLVALDVSGRYLAQHYDQPVDPRAAATGYVAFSRPLYRPVQAREETYGAHLTVTPTSWWRHNLVAGIDRYAFDYHSTRPRLTTPADTFLFVSVGGYSKVSFGYNTSITVPVPPMLSMIVTVGADHYTYVADYFAATSALKVNGAIVTPPGSPLTASRDETTNSGVFGQVQLGVWDALFVTGALRADRNSEVGDQVGTPLSRRLGISYVHGLGALQIKWRSSYGEAVQPPLPGLKNASPGTTSETLANDNLRPERQRGTDVGVDVLFGDRGSLSATYYSQVAEDLIQTVLVNATTTPLQYQSQNVGRIKNTGVELEGSATLGAIRLHAQYAITNSRVKSLAPGYSGDMRVGDQVRQVPQRTGGLTLTWMPFSTTMATIGMAYVGARTYFDLFAQYKCIARTGPCRSASRDYYMSYPAFVKTNLSVSQRIRGGLWGLLQVDNLANETADEVNNLTPVPGRTTLVGVRYTF
jgi:outer membrane receptor protein involved in Fe transport